MIYHIGAKALVELHIVMDEKLPLKVNVVIYIFTSISGQPDRYVFLGFPRYLFSIFNGIDLCFQITHDISHPLEQKLNRLDFVQRSFVHCDYSCDGDH